MALPNPFQSATVPSPVFNSTPKSSQNDATFFYGYRSNFNINQQKEEYQQRVDHQNHQKPKFYQNNQYQNNRSNRNAPNEKFIQNTGSNTSNWCDLCNCCFKYPQQLEKHLGEHEKCWFDNCNFEGHSKLLQKHIETQHPSAMIQRVPKTETDEDIEKWRLERKKRYPTKENIEARRLAQEERMKRGERITEPNNRFGNMKNRKSAQQRSFTQNQNDSTKNESGKKNNDNKRRRNRNNRNKNDKTDKKKPNDVVEIAKSVSPEKPILSSPTEQCSSEPKEKTATNALAALSMYGFDSDDDDDDEETTAAEQKEDNKQENDVSIGVNTIDDVTTLSDPNPKTIESNENGTDEITENITRKRVADEVNELPVKQIKIESDVPKELIVQCTETKSDDDDAPEEEPIQRQSGDIEDKVAVESGPTQIKPEEKKKSNSKASTNEKIVKHRTVLDVTRRIRNQNTLLEKLLQKDIRHERNILLQCVRYVVENNFFGIGQKTNEQKNHIDNA